MLLPKTISSLVLILYLDRRKISLSLAEKYCSEIIFRIYNKTYVALRFKNASGGNELRNELFEGSNTPKGITRFKNRSKIYASISSCSSNEIRLLSNCNHLLILERLIF
jgi:hypothetical protein